MTAIARAETTSRRHDRPPRTDTGDGMAGQASGTRWSTEDDRRSAAPAATATA